MEKTVRNIGSSEFLIGKGGRQRNRETDRGRNRDREIDEDRVRETDRDREREKRGEVASERDEVRRQRETDRQLLKE